jgi:hypothetical protein
MLPATFRSVLYEVSWRQNERWATQAQLRAKPLVYTPVSRRAVLCDWIWRRGGGSQRIPPHKFNFFILPFTLKLSCGNGPVVKNYIYSNSDLWPIDPKINRILRDFRMITLVLYIGSLPNLATWFPCGKGRTLFMLGSLGQRSPLL